MASPSLKGGDSRPGQQLLPGYVVKLLKTLKIPYGTDRTMNGVDVDPTIGILSHIVDCMGALRDVNKIYRAKGSLSSRSVGARAMFGFTAELGNILLDAITFNPPHEFQEAATHYITVANFILNVFPEIAAQVTKETGKMLIHHTALKAAPAMAMEALRIVVKAHPAGAMCQDVGGALPLHWITHNMNCNFEMVTLLISAYPQATGVNDADGYVPLHWAVNQDQPNIDVIAALLASDVKAASKPCNKGSLPLHWCVNRDQPSLAVVEALVKAYPDALRTFCDDGWLPIHRCVDRSKMNIEVLRLLIELYPQGLQCPNADGQLPLHKLLDHANPCLEALEMILQAYPGGAQVSDDEGYLPLHLVLDCAAPSVAAAKILINAYPDAARRKSRDGLLPLHCIVSSANPPFEIVQMLLDLFPESPEYAAIDVVPADEAADPETWTGEWVKKKWSPLTRAIGRKMDGVVTLLRTALQKKKFAESMALASSPPTGARGTRGTGPSGMGEPLNTVDPYKATRQFLPQSQPPLHSPNNITASMAHNSINGGGMSPTNRDHKLVDEFLEGGADGDGDGDRDRVNRLDQDRQSDYEQEQGRRRDNGRDRDRDHERRRRRDKSTDGERDRDRDRDRDRNRDRDRDEYRHRHSSSRDIKSSRHRSERHSGDEGRRGGSTDRPGRHRSDHDANSGEKERDANGDDPHRSSSGEVSASKGHKPKPLQPPPMSLVVAAERGAGATPQRPVSRRGREDNYRGGVSQFARDDFSDDGLEEEELGHLSIRTPRNREMVPISIDDIV